MIRQESLPSTEKPGAGRLWIAAQGPESAAARRADSRNRQADYQWSKSRKSCCGSAARPCERSALESAIDGKIRSTEGKIVDARPFASFWSERREGPESATEEPKLMIDAAPREKKPLKIFYSYAHEDEKFRVELGKASETARAREAARNLARPRARRRVRVGRRDPPEARRRRTSFCCWSAPTSSIQNTSGTRS